MPLVGRPCVLLACARPSQVRCCLSVCMCDDTCDDMAVWGTRKAVCGIRNLWQAPARRDGHPCRVGLHGTTCPGCQCMQRPSMSSSDASMHGFAGLHGRWLETRHRRSTDVSVSACTPAVESPGGSQAGKTRCWTAVRAGTTRSHGGGRCTWPLESQHGCMRRHEAIRLACVCAITKPYPQGYCHLRQPGPIKPSQARAGASRWVTTQLGYHTLPNATDGQPHRPTWTRDDRSPLPEWPQHQSMKRSRRDGKTGWTADATLRPTGRDHNVVPQCQRVGLIQWVDAQCIPGRHQLGKNTRCA